MSLGGTILGTASVLIRPSTTGFTTELTSQVNKATASASGVANSGSGLASFGKVATEVFVGVAAASVDMATKIDTAQAGLAQAISNTGQNIDQFKNQIDAAITSGEKLGNNAATTEQALTRLTSATQSPTEAIAALHAAQEIAAATGDNFTKVVVDLSHASEGNYTALERLGIITKAQVPTLGSFGDALQLIQTRYGGVAEAQANTFGGQLKADRAQIEDLAGAFGNDLIPVIEGAGHVFQDVAGFFEHNAAAADALAVVVGGVLTAAVGAYSIKIASSVFSTIKDTFTATGVAAQGLAVKLGIVSAAQDEEAAASTQLIAAQGATEASLAEVVALLQSESAYAQTTAEAVLQLAQAHTALAGASLEAGAGLADEGAYFTELQARVDVTTIAIDEQEQALVDLMASEELSVTAVAEFSAEIASMRAEVEAIGPVLVAAAAEGDGFSESVQLVTGTLGILDDQLVESRASLEAFTAAEVTTAEETVVLTEDATLLGTALDLALGPIGLVVAAAAVLGSTFLDTGNKASAASAASTNFVQGFLGTLSSDTPAEKIKAINAEMDKLNAQTQKWKNEGFTGDFANGNNNALKDLTKARNDIAQAQAGANAAAGGVDTGAITNDETALAAAQTKLSDTTQKVTADFTKYQSASTTLATAQNTLVQEQSTVDQALTRSGQYAITLSDDYNSMRSASLNLSDAESTLSDEQTTLAQIMNDTGQYARDLVDAQTSLASAQQSVTDDTTALTTAQQNLAQALNDTGQYALTLADDQNKLAAANTSLDDAQVKAAQAQQNFNAITHDSGAYLESQQKDTIALAQAQLQQQDAATALITAQNNLNNLTQDSKALTDALSESHGNVALAQELANIQQGDAKQNSTAYQKAVEDVEKAQLDQKSATLSVKDAQQALLLLDQESIPGTLAYREQVDTLANAQQAVANATITRANAQQTVNDQLAAAIPGTQQYNTLVEDVAKAQNTLAQANNTVSNDQAKLTALVNEAIPGTEQYAANQRILGKDQVAVWQAQSQVNSTTLAYNKLLDESIPGTQAYDSMMQTLAGDKQAVANAAQAQATAEANYNLQLLAQVGALKQVTDAQSTLSGDKGGIGNFFKGLADNFLTFAKTAYSSPTGGKALPGRVAGGPVISGTAYQVGEDGPEVFVAPADGQIVPNSAFSGSAAGGIDISVANIDALEAVVNQWAQSNTTLANAYNNGPARGTAGSAPLPPGLVQLTIDARGATPDAVAALRTEIPGIVQAHIVPVLQQLAGVK